MKRTMLLAILLMAMMMLAACGNTADDTADSAATTVNEAATDVEEAVDDAATEVDEAVDEAEGEMEEATDEAEGAMDDAMAGTMAELSEAPEQCTALPLVEAFDVDGDIIVAGSSTVYPLTQAMADRFTDEGYEGQITIDSIGSGAGFERFCVSAETDISNASRPIKDEEIASCEENGRTPIEFRVGTDALAVSVSTENDFVDNLTLEQLAQVFSGEAATWQDVNPDWPAEEISIFTPGEDSGTFDYFVEAVFEEDPEPLLGNTNAQFSEDDNVLVQGIEGSPYAIGYFGYAYYVENQDQLRTVSIEGVEPNEQTAESNEYPLSRPLFVYSAQSIIDEKPQVGQFLNFYLNFVDEEIIDVGYFPASDEALGNACAALGDTLQ
ncbi:MAG: PstS family phosphate ABC transporter substrate-binding protein [Anaerolineales bacterium]|nr:PstS family phosphate ABC transporter substrate-binding protein [Anaerolineales bacterium]MCB9126809.1 PstS family phosphate ABC transporter substrate-binding protein [Ardenticatenales bacterium]